MRFQLPSARDDRNTPHPSGGTTDQPREPGYCGSGVIETGEHNSLIRAASITQMQAGNRMSILTTSSPALPEEVFQHLVESVDAATAQAERRGVNPYHYTFWYDLSTEPGNAVESVAQSYLRALLPEDIRRKAKGVEYWLGRLSPPYASNFEFGVHQDVGRNPQNHELEFPMVSSILYLNTVNDGPLVVFPGPPNLADEDKSFVFPREKLFAWFPGQLWHAVVNRSDVTAAPAAREHVTRLNVLLNWWPFRPVGETSGPMKMIAGDYDGTIFGELE